MKTMEKTHPPKSDETLLFVDSVKGVENISVVPSFSNWKSEQENNEGNESQF